MACGVVTASLVVILCYVSFCWHMPLSIPWGNCRLSILSRKTWAVWLRFSVFYIVYNLRNLNADLRSLRVSALFKSCNSVFPLDGQTITLAWRHFKKKNYVQSLIFPSWYRALLPRIDQQLHYAQCSLKCWMSSLQLIKMTVSDTRWRIIHVYSKWEKYSQ